MEHLVYYDIAAAFVLLTALVAYHLRKYSDNFQSRVYRVMLYALLVVSTSDFLLFWEEITFGKTGTTVLLYICILGQVVAAAAYLLYILCLTGRVERFIRKEKGWLFVPAWIVIALLVVQLFIPYLFKVGTDGSYQRQNGIMLFYLCMIYFYLILYYFYRYMLKSGSNNKILKDIHLNRIYPALQGYNYYPVYCSFPKTAQL